VFKSLITPRVEEDVQKEELKYGSTEMGMQALLSEGKVKGSL
jgi:hypothetical protein